MKKKPAQKRGAAHVPAPHELKLWLANIARLCKTEDWLIEWLSHETGSRYDETLHVEAEFRQAQVHEHSQGRLVVVRWAGGWGL